MKDSIVLVVVNARFLTQPITGVQKFAIEISLRLKRLMPSIVFVAPPFIKHQDIANQLEVKLIGGFNSHLWEQFELPKFLKNNKNPLLINFANTAPLFYKPQIVTIHDLAFKVNPNWFAKSFVMVYNFLIPRIANRSSRIITVSQSAKKEIVDTYNISYAKVSVINNAVKIVELSYKNEISFKYNLDKFILTVGSIDPRKNMKNLIQAFNLIKTLNYKLVIVGGNNRVFANSLAGKNGSHNIIFTGYLSDQELAVLYSKARVFVYPSLYEGFGIPPLEAMAYGCPTIVSDISSLREICGEASLFVDPNSIKSLANTIEYVLDNDIIRCKLIEAGRKQVNKYSWDRSANRVSTLIKEVEKEAKSIF